MDWGEKPVIVLGYGVRAAKADASRALELGVPVISSWQGTDLVDNWHPMYFGRPGIYGQRAANRILYEADTILAIGCRMCSWMIGHAGLRPEQPDVMRVLTPAYASPEQVRGEAITTATDVYGLAGVLYHLLAGHPSQRFRERSPAEIERVICETLPVAPSCTELDAEAAAARGHASPERLRRALRGDLDNIVSVGLRKEPERRYATVSRFSEDLRAFLEGWPVSARRDDVGYRISKFVARHRLAVSATAAVFLVLVGLGGALAVQADRLERQRDLAEERRVAAEQVSHFLVDLFRSSDPNQSRGDSVTAREVLDRGAARIAVLEGQPAVRATLENAMGLVYKNLGRYEPAEALLRSSLEARRTQAGVAPDLILAV
jgi:serine/threonine-protein kinase